MTYNPSSGLASGASGQKVVTITGADIAVIQPGAVMTFVSDRGIRSGSGYVVQSVAPAGGNGGTITLQANLASTITNSGFLVDGISGTLSEPVWASFSLQRVLNALQSWFGYTTSPGVDDRVLALDKGAADARAEVLFRLTGQTKFRLGMALEGGVQKLKFQSSTDGVGFSDLITFAPGSTSIAGLTLAADASTAMQAVTKQQFDAGPIKVLNTYIDASKYGVSPGATDNAPLIQSAIDNNPGCTIVIPSFNGADLPMRTTVFHDVSNTGLLFDRCRFVRPAGVYLKDSMFAVRKRAGWTGSGKLTGVTISGDGYAYFSPVTSNTFTATAGQTVFSWTSPATAKADFAIFRVRGGVATYLSTSSDLSAGGATGFTLTAAAQAGDTYIAYVTAADARTGFVSVEGLNADRVTGFRQRGRLECEGFSYVSYPNMYYDDVAWDHVVTRGGIDRAGIYPYLAGTSLKAYRQESYGKMARGPSELLALNGGAGVEAAYYGLNHNATGTIDGVSVDHLIVEDMAGHACLIGGGCKNVRIGEIRSKNPGFYHFISLHHATADPQDIVVDWIDAEGATKAEPIYILSVETQVRGGIVRGASGAVRVGGSGVVKSGNAINLRIDGTTAGTALLVSDQEGINFGTTKITNPPAGSVTGASLSNLNRPTGLVDVDGPASGGGGDGALLSGVTNAPDLVIAGRRKSRGALAYSNSTANVLRFAVGGSITTGVEIAAGSNDNHISGVAKGASFPLINGGTGNNVAALVV